MKALQTHFVIPAKAGIHFTLALDSRFRGNDEGISVVFRLEEFDAASGWLSS